MGRHIHVHLNGDAFNEEDHPRAQNGKFGAGGGGASKTKRPTAPNLPGPNAQRAIKAIQAAATKGDWRAVENVNLLGIHPQVVAFRNAVSKHLQAGGKAVNEATGRPAL